MPSEFTKITTLDNLAEGMVKGFGIGYERFALVKVDGEVYALDDFCSHAGGTLSSGVLYDGEVVCPLHGAQFDVRTGKQSVGPSLANQPTYPVRIEGNDVLVGPVNDGPAAISAGGSE